jgi:mRNA interferase YafQ
LVLRATTKFKKGLKRQEKRGKDMAKLTTVIETLAARDELEPRYKDHALTGDWKGCRECHIEPDWLLVYREIETELVLETTGTHSDIFE